MSSQRQLAKTRAQCHWPEWLPRPAPSRCNNANSITATAAMAPNTFTHRGVAGRELGSRDHLSTDLPFMGVPHVGIDLPRYGFCTLSPRCTHGSFTIEHSNA